jgi:DNA polymerase-3 subunit gamma/tau
MSYEVLARKWRPRGFEQVVGQRHVLQALINALNQGRLHHAYLFTGTRGVGKTTLARILAKCLNCETAVSARPCGECGSCREIDEGRFVDLIEVDAASRTKVEDTRELLENVQYAPTRGRYKVYLIDEVHMLSGHSFNALLKTLEEPPPHVKFLLATTDPQRLPVTVLSRCLQFNLKSMSASMISGHLRHVAAREGITADETALMQLARVADGSMRDALSLLDQAIAFGQGEVRDSGVADMLGAIPRVHFQALVSGLANRNAGCVMEAVSGLAEQTADFEQALAELLSLCHQAALYQLVPESLDEGADIELVSMLAQTTTPEDIQLFYQIALMGRRDLALVPDPKAGFEMVLLRMLSFQPLKVETTTTTQPAEAPPKRPARPEKNVQAEAEEARRQRARSEAAPVAGVVSQPPKVDWSQVLRQLGLQGVAYALASNCSFKSYSRGEIRLVLEAQHAQIRTKNAEVRLQSALSKYFSEEIRLRIDIDKHSMETPAQLRSRDIAGMRQAAEKAIDDDTIVREFKERLGAKVIPGSVRPVTDADD